MENLQKHESVQSSSEPEESSEEKVQIKEVKSESSDEEAGQFNIFASNALIARKKLDPPKIINVVKQNFNLEDF